ncbi:MFS transporter [Devosia sp.]|uniref:MFS transporter n=1 Tax=Devosia sp. TaxID=1871048 RepID=UPI0025D96068|nr:MFS transporter [Devosia sp.]MCR6637188.1 MFS transporter [Devosia sp.]
MRLSAFLRVYYAYAFLFDFIFAYAVYTALFSLEGLSTSEIGVLLAFWSASAIVLEMPSGALSDHFDRRVLLVFAPLAKAGTFVLWGLAQGDFWIYGAGFLLWSLGQALQSGSREALLYERMAAEGRTDEFDKVLGRDNAAEGLGIGLGTLFGGFVAYWSFEWAIWLSIPPLLVAAILAFWLEDVRRNGVAEDDGDVEGGYFTHFVHAWREFRERAELRFVTTYIATGLLVFEVLEEFDELYYLAVSLPVWAWGIVAAGVEAIFALASIHAYRLAGRPWLAWTLPALGGVLLIAASQGRTAPYVLLLAAGYIVVAPVTVLAEARFQKIMEGKSRATTTSALVMAENVVGIVATLVFGFLADWVGILPAYGWAGLVMAPFVFWVIARQRRGFRATD